MAPVIRELKARSSSTDIQPVVCVTGQHREMLRQVMRLFDLDADYDLDIMTSNQTPTRVAAAVLREMEMVLDRERPDWMLVQGDTTTAAAAALAAFYGSVRVGHVEAGLRTFNRREPFPEEINRRLAGVLADTHFAPTARARDNLLAEGVQRSDILLTGNTVVDALHEAATIEAGPGFHELLRALGYGSPADVGDAHATSGNEPAPRIILVTAHRRENLGPPLQQICRALRRIVEHYEGRVKIVYPVHPNPKVRETVESMLGDLDDVVLTAPLEYQELARLLQIVAIVLTDSGGIQEEAPSFGVPVLVLRDVTERPEGVEAEVVKLIGCREHRIVAAVRELLDDPLAHRRMSRAVNPYGDGSAARRIVARLLGEPVEEFDAKAAAGADSIDSRPGLVGVVR